MARAAGRVTRKARRPTPEPDRSSDAQGAEPSLTLRVDLGAHGAIGPGKIRLLELIAETGSISAAGRAMGMSYRQAWLLIDSLNQAFREAVTTTLSGGAKGGGAALTAAGKRLVALYRDLEAVTTRAARNDLAAVAAMLRAEPPSEPMRDVKEKPKPARRGSRTTRS